MLRDSNPSVVIVTPDLIGPVANGGIGTSCTALAEFLAAQGYRVSVLLTLPEKEQMPLGTWRARYDHQGIAVCTLPAETEIPLTYPDHPHLVRSYEVYRWLRDKAFDIIIFMEWQGAGFYALSAKKCGLAFQNSWLVTHVHSPTVWHAIHSCEPFSHPSQLLTSFLERRSIELADMVLSPTGYMLDWVRDYGWSLPPETRVIPNLLPEVSAYAPPPRSKVETIVFFGRLEMRKGLDLFCDAIDLIEASGRTLPSVTFLGKFGRCGNSHAGTYICARANKWRSPIAICSDLDQLGALAWLAENRTLAIMPSLMDNAPYTIAECMELGIPFLARAVGGVSEMVAPEHAARCLVSDNPRQLAERILAHLDMPPEPVMAAVSQQAVRTAWADLVATLASTPPPSLSAPSATPLVSICITHKDRPTLLMQAIESVRAQTYPLTQVILVDDGSVTPEAQVAVSALEADFARRGWSIIRQKNCYLGAARNAAARVARGEWLLFLDDDNVCMPHHIATLVQAAQASGADILTSFMDVFEGAQRPNSDISITERFLPLGGTATYGLFENVYGDACALYRKSLFDVLGGFSEDYGLGCEDHEFFARAVLGGAQVQIVPETLYWYRRDRASMLRTTPETRNAMRALRPYLTAHGADLREVALLAHGALSPRYTPDHKPPILALLHAALAVVREMGDRREAKERFGRIWAMTLLDELVTDLDGAAAPNGRDAALRMAILLFCCNHLEAARRVAYAVPPAQDGMAANELECAGAILFSMLEGRPWSAPPQAHLLIIKAIVAASWFLPVDQNALGIFEEILGSDPIVKATLLVPQLVYDLLNDRDDAAAASFEGLCSAHEWRYLAENPDVAVSISQGVFASGFDHFARYGHREGRSWPLGEIVCELTQREAVPL